MLKPIEVISLYPQHHETLWSLLSSRAAAVPEREFLVFQGRSYGYRETARQVERAAAMYAARGVKAGDRVGVMSLNHPSTVFTILALARLGAIMAPVNPDYGVEEARYVLTHAQVSGVLSSPAALATVREACRELAPSPWFMVNEPYDADVPSFATELERAGADAPPEDGSPGSTCVFIYTSGTTGFPKGVMHSQRNVILAGEGFVERMYLQPSDRLLCILPMFRVNAIFCSLAGSLAAGATLLLEPRFSASRFWPVVRDTGATEVDTIAAMSEVPGVLNNPFEGPHKIGSMGKPSRHPNHDMPFSEIPPARADAPGGKVQAPKMGR